MSEQTAVEIPRREKTESPIRTSTCISCRAETYRFSYEVFDNNGDLKTSLISLNRGVGTNGTGVWGPEVNIGSLVYIKDVNVRETFRRKGFGDFMVKTLLSCPEVQDCRFAYGK